VRRDGGPAIARDGDRGTPRGASHTVRAARRGLAACESGIPPARHAGALQPQPNRTRLFPRGNGLAASQPSSPSACAGSCRPQRRHPRCAALQRRTNLRHRDDAARGVPAHPHRQRATGADGPTMLRAGPRDTGREEARDPTGRCRAGYARPAASGRRGHSPAALRNDQRLEQPAAARRAARSSQWHARQDAHQHRGRQSLGARWPVDPDLRLEHAALSGGGGPADEQSATRRRLMGGDAPGSVPGGPHPVRCPPRRWA
jgi:hypothetical protein